MKHSLRAATGAVCLAFCLLFSAGCSVSLPPRFERNVQKINLGDEWNKIVRYTNIDGGKAMLNDLIIRYDRGGTVTAFYFNFYVKENADRYTMHSIQFNGDDNIKYTAETVAQPIDDSVLVGNVFGEIDRLGFAQLGGEYSGDVGMMMKAIWGETNYASDSAGKVYEVNDGETVLIDEGTYSLGRNYIALNVWEDNPAPETSYSKTFILKNAPPQSE